MFEKNEEGITAMKKSDYFYSVVISKVRDKSGKRFSDTPTTFKEAEELFHRKLKN